MIRLLKHPNNTDVAMEVVKRYYVGEKDVWKLHVRWWNIGLCHAPWDMECPQKITISTDKFMEFKPYKWEGKQNEENTEEET